MNGKPADTRGGAKPVFGIAGKLFAAFGVLAGGIVLASAVAWLVFTKIEQSVGRVIDDSVPGMVIALDLAELSAEIAATAPSIGASVTQSDRIRAQATLEERGRRLGALIDQLAARSVAPDQISGLSRIAGGLRERLDDLNLAVEARIAVRMRRQGVQARLSLIHARFEELLEPMIDDSVFSLVIGGERVTAESTEMLTDLVESGVSVVDHLLTINAEGNMAAGLIAEAVWTVDPGLMSPLRERFTAAAAAIDRILGQVPPSPDITALQRTIDALLAFGRDPQNVFDARRPMKGDETSASGQGQDDLTRLHDDLKVAHDRFLLQLTPMIDDAAFEMVLATESLTENSTASLTELIDVGANTLYLLLTLRAEGNQVAGLLNAAASSPETARLQPLRERFVAAQGHLNRAVGELPESADVAAIVAGATDLLGLGTGNDGIFALRRQELEHAGAAQSALEASRTLAVQLGDEVARAVAAAREASDAVGMEAAETIESGKFSLLAISLAGLICATVMMLAYVRPRIIRPLENMTAAMTQLAGGDTSVDVPYRERTDEMGRMAQALGVFRDTAVEVQRTSLREIETARRRLADAIESISEAFSLYDPEDQLVVCNEKYRTLLYPDIAEEITPGMRFEDIVRRAAERGDVVDAEGRTDDWIAERIARRRNPGEPHIQRRADGRWIMVSERRTAEGGTVAVYSDITELKQREVELASKSNTLERLSNQLAKYLAPQVYESIFTGQQEVKLTSRRRKLTVFFSDIAGFTETADRMESEELTALLNHYLTEMSQIALAHGATIDKYVGDAIVIFFGDPETRGVAEDALACVRMAIAMRDRMQELEGIWRDSGIEKPLKCRMGINTGFCTVGNFGSEDRMDYTIIGGGVNLASRLESSATPGEILVSYETYALVKNEIRGEERGKIEVKGIAYPVETFAVIDVREDGEATQRIIREHRPNLKLELDLEAMTTEEREENAAVLEDALRRLSDRD